MVSFEDNGSVAEIDDIDRGILRFMQEGRGDSDAEMARKLKIPLSTFTYRKDRLKEAGVIVAEVYRLNWNNTERSIYCALVSVSRLTTQFNDQFQKFCRDHRNIVLCHRCLGSWDYKVTIEAENREEIGETLQDLRHELEDSQGTFEVYQHLRERKTTFFPF